MEGQFHTQHPQKRIGAIATSLTIEGSIRKHIFSHFAELGVLSHDGLSRLNDRFPKMERRVSFKILKLMEIFNTYEWSRSNKEQMTQDKLQYDSFCTKLYAAIVIWEKERKRQGINTESEEGHRISGPLPSFVGHDEKYVHYLNDRNPSRIYNRQISLHRDRSSRMFRHPYQPSLKTYCNTSSCQRCNLTGHWRANCPFANSDSTISVVRALIRKLGGSPSQVAAKLLSELVSEEDGNQESYFVKD